MDKFTLEKRSSIMAAIPNKNTSPEKIIRSALFTKGFRYKLHRKDLPGKPDIVMGKYKICIFVNGCFWHGHNCKKGINRPKTNVDYWNNKIGTNIARDEKNYTLLSKEGWNVVVIWECSIKKDLEELLDKLDGLKV